MTAEPLKPLPCPMCGNERPEVYHECNIGKAMYRVRCNVCGIQTHLESKDMVISAWNRREPIGNSNELQSIIDMRIEELEEMVECNNTYRAHDLVLHEIATPKWVLSLKKEDS